MVSALTLALILEAFWLSGFLAVLDVVLGIGSSGAHYILISSDSVYMCCVPPGDSDASGVREEKGVRPVDQQLRQQVCVCVST